MNWLNKKRYKPSELIAWLEEGNQLRYIAATTEEGEYLFEYIQINMYTFKELRSFQQMEALDGPFGDAVLLAVLTNPEMWELCDELGNPIEEVEENTDALKLDRL